MALSSDCCSTGAVWRLGIKTISYDPFGSAFWFRDAAGYNGRGGQKRAIG